MQTFVDLKEVLKREFPGKISETVTEYMSKVDNAVDSWNKFITLGGLLGNPGPKSNIAKSLAVSVSESALGPVIRYVLWTYSAQIQAAAGITDAQLENFLGTGDESADR